MRIVCAERPGERQDAGKTASLTGDATSGFGATLDVAVAI
jgi:hypothetical protein